MTTATALSGAPGAIALRRDTRPTDWPESATAAHVELASVNEVVAASLRSWDLPARVRRLALPSLLYDEVDIEQMSVVLVEGPEGGVAVAAWEAAAGRDAVPGLRSVLLHGLYVTPRSQRQGLGTSLLDSAGHWTSVRGFEALTVKAWSESEAFFLARGFRPLAQTSSGDLYPRRMWKELQ